ncbi:MAG: hypothetical protein GXO36_02675 [Chloroflexi bacterium]|nr:hypothetical protein [Chloroflexota bacterium]
MMTLDALNEKIGERVRNKPALALGVAFLFGLFVGWFILGWGIAPVKWTNAAPQHLEPSWRQDYLRMVISDYIHTGNAELAKIRYKGLGDAAQSTLIAVERDPGYLPLEAVQRFQNEVASTVQAEAAAGTSGGTSLARYALLCLLALFIIGALAYLILRARSRGLSYKTKAEAKAEAAQAAGYTAEEFSTGPISAYTTTYELGNDFFDESFSIDSATGEFLGEAGISISEGIGSQPKKVYAFEVWLFDKSDIRTETIVLATPEAAADEALRQRLEVRGQIVEAQPQQQLVLETERLRADIFVRECECESDADGQYFKRLTVEFRIFQKTPTEAVETPGPEADAPEGLSF